MQLSCATTRRWRGGIGGLAVLALGATTASAQGSTFITVQTGTCNTGNTFLSGVVSDSISQSCGLPGDRTQGSAAWRIDAGDLRVKSSLTLTNVNRADGTSHLATAQAYWTDFVDVMTASVTPAFIDLYLRVSGATSASVTAPANNCSNFGFGTNQGSPSFASAGYYTSGGFVVLASLEHPFDAVVGSAACTGLLGRNWTVGSTATTFNQLLYAHVPLTASLNFGSADIAYGINAFTTMSYIDLAVGGNGRSVSGSATADFYNTMALERVAVFDAAGNDITASTAVNFASGRSVPTAPVIATPEPGTFALLGGGLVLIAARRHRRA